MLTAVTSDKSLVEAWRTEQQEGPWHCPECHAPVVLKRGRIVTPHFAHAASTTCTGKGESELHRKCKRELFEVMANDPRVTKLQLERGLGEVRPDVSAYINGAAVAIEVQVSRLPVDEIMRRTVVYHRKKVAVLWLSMWRDTLAEERMSPRPWEKWLHAAQFGRVYYWKPGDGATVVPFTYKPFYIDVPISTWYETGGVEQSAGGYQRISKRWKTPIAESRLDLLNDFSPMIRSQWVGGSVSVPSCRLFLAKRSLR